ncbi:hypothetical protein JTB14_000077 [Gonioctena quinquepunctata]|nr:hypothetical protein JTB14_000077 [Gonioctena quinquepunctata]
MDPNGITTHCPSSSWPEYQNPYAPPYSPQTPYYDPHQDSTHGTPIHLPTVLPDSSSGEYITTSLTSPPPPSTMLHSAKSDLDISARYPDNNSYYPNSWSTNPTYNNNYYYNPPYNQQQYFNHPPSVVVCPSLYSTVNQSQIHLHLHSTSDKSDPYLTDSLPLTSPQRVDVVQTATSEVVHPDSLRIEDSERVAQSQTDVWRPY